MSELSSPLQISDLAKDLIGFNNISVKPLSDNWKKAASVALHRFKLNDKVKVLHLLDMFKMDDLEIWSKFPGIPWCNNGYLTINDIKNDANAVIIVRKFWHFIKDANEVEVPDCLVHIRDVKKLAVSWNYPANIILGEVMLGYLLIREYKKIDLLPTKENIKSIQRRLAGHNYYIHLEFKNFDKTVPAWLLHIAFDISLFNISFETYEGGGVPITCKVHRIFKFITNYFINTPIKTSKGERFIKTGGIPQDSYWKEVIRIICATILINWIYEELSVETPEYILCVGDVSLIPSCKKLNLNQCYDLMQTIGMEINLQKSKITKLIRKRQVWDLLTDYNLNDQP